MARVSEHEKSYFLDVARRIEDGRYFNDAREWYKFSTLLPICERSYAALILAAVCFAFAVTMINVNLIGETIIRTPFAVGVEQGSNVGYYMTRLSDDSKENPQLSVANFMIGSFVETKEGYSPKLMTPQGYASRYRKIKTMSSKNIYNRYRAYMSQLNPSSPLRKYGNDFTRDIEVYSIEYSNNYLYSTHAKVQFLSKEIPIKGKDRKIKTDEWVADLHFRLSDVVSIARSSAPIKFQVTSYTVRKKK
ncbi:MAG: VirB8/TrbF family protein [Rickettsiales bacterium]